MKPDLDPSVVQVEQASQGGHTPGPWTITRSSFITYIKADTGHKEIAVMYAESGVDKKANAHLIAAAPELLAAAKMIASFAVSWQPLTPGDIRQLTDAIAKAEGRGGRS